MDSRARLVRALRNATDEQRVKLEELKRRGAALRLRPDALWRLLLQSFSTMGNSRGWRGLFETPGLLEQVEYERLQLMQSEQRIAIVAKVFRAATIRRPDTKAAWLSENVELLRLLGGPTLAWQQAIALPERAEKIQFLLRFKGIGDKYARNIWMDVYDDAFRDAIAVDERIKSVTRALGREFRTYADHEAFYQEVAADAGLEPWELDRLLYQFKAHFLAAISGAG